MHNRFGMVEAFFPRNRAESEPADIFDAAALDKIRHDIESLIEFLVIFGFKIRQRANQLPPTRDLPRKSFEPLLGAEVKVNVPASFELRGDFLEAVFFGGNRRCGRGGNRWRSGLLLFWSRRLALLAAIESDEAR